jgi:hypothetical protein
MQKDICNYCNNSFLNYSIQLQAATIGFTATTITDTASEFVDSLFYNSMDLKVYGSKLNDGIYEIKTVAVDTLTLETSVSQERTLKAETAENNIILTAVDFSKVSDFKLSMLMKYYLAREGKLVNNESLPGGYSANFKSVPTIWQPFDQYRKPYR